MIDDPIIAELRAIRQNIEASCDHDPEKFYAHLVEIQQPYRERLVRRAPKPAVKFRDARRAA